MKPIDPTVREWLTNLVIERLAPNGWTLSPDERRSLVEAMEDALIDRERIRSVLDHLRSIAGNPALDRAETIFDDDDVEAVLDGGLTALHERSPSLFDRALVDPFALLELRDNILANLPPYWWEKIRRRDGRAPRSPEQVMNAAFEAARPEAALAAFDADAGPRRWQVHLAADQIERIAPATAPAPAVLIEFALTPEEAGWRLDVDVLDPLPSADRRRSGRIATASGATLGKVDDAINLLTFHVDHDALAAGVTFECDDRRGADDHVRYRTPVVPA